ncbi:MysB family protein [Serratia sp. NPDC078593]|uniref:MysB family protein n=1 Tax=unclassified Serratia (in: enterobacteria) TaxID=2647522 RepID=UPI0037CD2B7E
MNLYVTLEEAIDAAREEFIESADDVDGDALPVPQQFNLQKYVMQEGEIMWQAEFFEEEGESVECLTLRSGAAAQAVFDGDYDEIEIREEWLDENTLYEWDEGDFQLEPPLDTEEGETAADEWDAR